MAPPFSYCRCNAHRQLFDCSFETNQTKIEKRKECYCNHARWYFVLTWIDWNIYYFRLLLLVVVAVGDGAPQKRERRKRMTREIPFGLNHQVRMVGRKRRVRWKKIHAQVKKPSGEMRTLTASFSCWMTCLARSHSNQRHHSWGDLFIDNVRLDSRSFSLPIRPKASDGHYY